MTFSNWIDTFFAEKEIDLEQTIEVQGDMGFNIMPVGVVLDAIKSTCSQEQKKIMELFVNIDFRNGDVMHLVKHLAQAIAL